VMESRNFAVHQGGGVSASKQRHRNRMETNQAFDSMPS
jgi:hypothetical protein